VDDNRKYPAEFVLRTSFMSYMLLPMCNVEVRKQETGRSDNCGTHTGIYRGIKKSVCT
jgi:hypothetical protein